MILVKNRSKQGVVLVYVILIFSLLVILASGMMTLSLNSRKATINQINNEQAYYTARSGLDLVMDALLNDPELAKRYALLFKRAPNNTELITHEQLNSIDLTAEKMGVVDIKGECKAYLADNSTCKKIEITSTGTYNEKKRSVKGIIEYTGNDNRFIGYPINRVVIGNYAIPINTLSENPIVGFIDRGDFAKFINDTPNNLNFSNKENFKIEDDGTATFISPNNQRVYLRHKAGQSPYSDEHVLHHLFNQELYDYVYKNKDVESINDKNKVEGSVVYVQRSIRSTNKEPNKDGKEAKDTKAPTTLKTDSMSVRLKPNKDGLAMMVIDLDLDLADQVSPIKYDVELSLTIDVAPEVKAAIILLRGSQNFKNVIFKSAKISVDKENKDDLSRVLFIDNSLPDLTCQHPRIGISSIIYDTSNINCWFLGPYSSLKLDKTVFTGGIVASDKTAEDAEQQDYSSGIVLSQRIFGRFYNEILDGIIHEKGYLPSVYGNSKYPSGGLLVGVGNARQYGTWRRVYE